ncbi:MAG: Rieske 2Fe-2S domain-containing protein [Mycobacteriaceae bacterium]|nr:Rieske 2Fe-2S domain-containing protein [Mycobacteriaceae bacterium]MBV9641125.1 Rieske 2Fe-2S domain-containing protein [Mycobacteriaceae bacterium]
MGASAGTPLADDAEIVRRILAHVDAGTTDEGPSWREPVQNYLDPRRFADELRVLRSAPSVFAPSAAIPGVGDHIERVSFGVPLFAVRDSDGGVRVFRNACRHRGMALVEGTGCSHALVCPYHGWTYRLDGSLAYVPHAEGFPDLDVSSRGLVEVASREVGGLVVIETLEPGPVTDADGLTDGAAWRAKMATRLIDVKSTILAINWKVLVEQFLEGYHIRSTHRETFYPLQYDDLNVVEIFGPNSRIAFPYRNVERLRDRPESTWVIGHRVTFVYHLFPNVMLATFPDRMIVVVIDPIDLEHSTFTTYAMDGGPAPGHRRADGGRGRALVDRGAIEDNAMSEAVQRGLHAGANAFVEFGRHESAIGHFHATLDDRLGRLEPLTQRSATNSPDRSSI